MLKCVAPAFSLHERVGMSVCSHVLVSQDKKVTSVEFNVETNFVISGILGSDVAVCTLCNLATLSTETRVPSMSVSLAESSTQTSLLLHFVLEGPGTSLAMILKCACSKGKVYSWQSKYGQVVQK